MANQIIFGATIVPANAAMEVSINSGTSFAALAYTTVGSSQQGTLTGVPAATYAIGQLIQGAIGYPATRLSNTVAVTVAAAATGATTTYSALTADYQNSAYDGAIPGTTARRRGALAYVDLLFTSGVPASVSVKYWSEGDNQPLVALVDGVYAGQAVPAFGGQEGTGSIALNGTAAWATGSHTVRLVDGTQQFQAGIRRGTQLITAVFQGANTFSVVPRDTTSEVIFIDSNSIGVGILTTTPATDSLGAQLNKLHPALYVNLGSGGRRIDTSYAVQTDRAAVIAACRAFTGAGSARPVRLISEMGVNDASNGGVAATSAGYMNNFWTEFHTEFSQVQIVEQTPLTYFNSDGPLVAYRTALANAAAPNSYIQVVAGPTLIDASTDTADGLHPNTVGTATKYAPRLAAAIFQAVPGAILFTGTEVTATTNVWKAATAGGGSYATSRGGPNYKIAAGTSGRIFASYIDGAALESLIGFDTDNVLKQFTGFPVSLYIHAISPGVGETLLFKMGANSTAGALANGDLYGLSRNGSTGVIMAQKSTNGGSTWTDLFDTLYVSTADLFIKCDIRDDVGRLNNPRGTGLVLA